MLGCLVEALAATDRNVSFHEEYQLNRVKNSVEKFQKQYACSQAILSEYCEQYGLSTEIALKITSGFAGGMRMGSTCGAVSGAFMVLGLEYGENNCETIEGRKNVYNAITEITKEFEKIYGTVECKKLLGYDIGTKDGMKAVMEKKLFQTVCPKIVETAAKLLEQKIKKS